METEELIVNDIGDDFQEIFEDEMNNENITVKQEPQVIETNETNNQTTLEIERASTTLDNFSDEFADGVGQQNSRNIDNLESNHGDKRATHDHEYNSKYIENIKLLCLQKQLVVKLDRTSLRVQPTNSQSNKVVVESTKHDLNAYKRKRNRIPLGSYHEDTVTDFHEAKARQKRKAQSNGKPVSKKDGENPPKMYYCEEAECTFKSIYFSSLWAHKSKRHTEIRKHACQFCSNTSYTHRYQLDCHLLSKHKESINISEEIKSKILQCPQCSYYTILRQSLKMHLRDVHKEAEGHLKKIKCEQCEYSTYSSTCIKRHMSIHNKIKPYACTICSKNFIQKLHLHSHILNNHYDNKDMMAMVTSKLHKCDQCHFVSLRKTRYTLHMQNKHKLKAKQK